MIFRSRNAGAKPIFFALLASLTCLALPLRAAELRILALEQVSSSESKQPAARGSTPGLRLHLAGAQRQADLLLEPNTDLLPGGQRGATQAFRGTLPGATGSWARLTRRAGAYQGLYFDGREFFAVDQARNAAHHSAQAAALSPGEIVRYRMADLQITGARFAGDTAPAIRTGAEALAQLTAELASAQATALLTTKRLDVALLADAELVALDGADTEANAIARLNVVDGIFSTQLGVALRLSGLTQYSAAGQPFTSTDPATLLEQLKTVRSSSASQQASGLSHLFTGRDLDAQTVGISYVGGLCSRSFGASLSEARTSIPYDALIQAHELGHSFGAPHDGDPAGACASTDPSTYLMAPKLTGSATFSDCSVQVMNTFIATASCLAQVDAADATITVPLLTRLALNQPTTVGFSVRSVGNAPVNAVSVTITPPSDVTLGGAGVAGGRCTANAGSVSCNLGTLAVDESRDVQLSLTGTVIGTSSVTVQLTAANDGLAQNNLNQLALSTAPGADLLATLQAEATNVSVGQDATLHVLLSNSGLATAPDALLTLALPNGITVSGVSTAGIACAAVAAQLQCQPGTLAANTQASATLTLHVDQAGTLPVTANVSSASLADPDSGNNSATVTLTATAASTGNGSTGGGGGEVDPSSGALLALCLLSRFRPRPARPRSP